MTFETIKISFTLLVLGESSAGKSSLINLILGKNLLPNHVLNTTSTICELKYGEERQLVVHYKYDIDQQRKLPPRPLPLKTEEESGKSYQEQIAPFVGKGSNCEKVEIFWPHELLEVHQPSS
jgi:receptor-interacting serine/threonine-protein kinase 5